MTESATPDPARVQSVEPAQGIGSAIPSSCLTCRRLEEERDAAINRADLADAYMAGMRAACGQPLEPLPEPYRKGRLNYEYQEGLRLAHDILDVFARRTDRAQDRARELEEERDQLRAHAEQHRTLCLAELGGDAVWPCGCHSRVEDSYGTTRLLTGADGEIHQECEDHAAIRAALVTAQAQLAAMREALKAIAQIHYNRHDAENGFLGEHVEIAEAALSPDLIRGEVSAPGKEKEDGE